jgi:hypothetical protein
LNFRSNATVKLDGDDDGNARDHRGNIFRRAPRRSPCRQRWPADIFTNEQQSAVRAEPRRGVQPAGFIEGFLFPSTTVTSTPTRPIRASS